MTDVTQEIISTNEKSAKVVRYDGQVPNELKAQLILDGALDHQKQQAIFEVQGVGMVLCESSDGEHWQAIAALQEAALETPDGQTVGQIVRQTEGQD